MTDDARSGSTPDSAVEVPHPWGLDERTARALSATTRRRVLDVLLGTDGEWSLSELASVLAGWKATASGGMTAPDERRRIEAELHHQHLPHLDAVGLASYDPASKTVSPEPVDEAVERAVTSAIEDGDDD
jgi:hypothetical protein